MEESRVAIAPRRPLRVGTWNVRSLNGPGAARLLVHELARAGVNIMGLQEVRWLGAGELVVDGYTILWSGPEEGAVRRAGVALVLDKLAVSALKSWNPLSDRVMMANFRYTFGDLTIVTAYAPTNEADAVDKDNFYATLEYALSTVKRGSAVVCVGGLQCGFWNEQERL